MFRFFTDIGYLFAGRDKRIILSILAIVLVFVNFLFIDTARSTFICNSTICEVQNETITGIVKNKIPVNIQEITNFTTSKNYNFWASRTSRYSYTVTAHTTTGRSYRFFEASKHYEPDVDKTVGILKSYLPTTQDKANIYVKF